MKTHEESFCARRAGAIRAATVFCVVAGCCFVATLPGQMRDDNGSSSSGVYAQAVDDSTTNSRAEWLEHKQTRIVSENALLSLASQGAERSAGPGSLSTGFEQADGFALGAIFNQAGWGAFQVAPEGHIDNVNPASGSQHLRISKDPSLPTLTNTGAFSPDLGPLATGPSTTSVDIAIGATGGAIYPVIGQSLSEGLITWELFFVFDGTIFVVDDLGAGLVVVDSGALWTVGPYQNLTVCDDPVAGTTEYFYNGTLIYSQVTHLGGTRVEQVILFSDNFQFAEDGDFDNLSIQPGLSGVCGGCAPGAPGEIVLDAGDDGWSTGDGGAVFTFGDPFGDQPGELPIPADFFGPGSDPFEGAVNFTGERFVADPNNPDGALLGVTDTIIRRNECTLPLGIGDSDTVEIEIVALSLISTQPITVTFNGGQSPTQYSVNLCLSSQSAQCPGSMTITRNDTFGGTFVSDFPVVPKFTFVGTGGPFELDLGAGGVDCASPPLVLRNAAADPNSWAVMDEVGGPTRAQFGINGWPAGIDFNANCTGAANVAFNPADPTNVTTVGTSNFQGGLDTGGSVPDSCTPPFAGASGGPPAVKCKKSKEGCERFASNPKKGSHSSFISSDADDNGNNVPDVCEGECCLPDGSCKVDDEEACCDAGGTYSGNDTKCETNKGACCMPDGTCVQNTTKKCCELAGGQYMGDGSTSCPVPPCEGPEPDPHATWSDGLPGLNDATFGSKTNPPIPADFFGPGSDPFVGTVSLRGRAIDPATTGNASTLVQRLGPVPLPNDPVGTQVTIPIEMIELSLVSTEPITVTLNGGQSPEQWNVAVTHAGLPLPDLGQMTITKTHANGGTFDSFLFVQPVFTFSRVGNPSDVRVLNTVLEGIPPVLLQAANIPYVQSVNPGLHFIAPSDGEFVPGVEELVPGDPESQHHVPATLDDPVAGVTHTVDPPRPPDPHTTRPGRAITQPSHSRTKFGNDVVPPIPADFFGPGSDPFTGLVLMEGVPLDPADPETSTLILRQEDPTDPADPIGTTRTIEVELVALSLKSIDPITVRFGATCVGGANNGLACAADVDCPGGICSGNSEPWDVTVTLSDLPSSPGSLTATKTHCNGGTFDMSLEVRTKLTFTNADGTQVRVLDTAVEGIAPFNLATQTPAPWVHKLNATLEGTIQAPFDGVFVPGVLEAVPGCSELNTNGIDASARKLTKPARSRDTAATTLVIPPGAQAPAPFVNTCADVAGSTALSSTGGTLDGTGTGASNDFGRAPNVCQFNNEPCTVQADCDALDLGVCDDFFAFCSQSAQDCGGAIVCIPRTCIATGSGWDATADGCNPGGSWGSSGNDVVLEFTVDTTGDWTFTTCPGYGNPGVGGPAGGISGDSSIAIFDGSGGCIGAVVACNGDGGDLCPGFTSELVDVPLTAGDTYFLLVDGWSAADSGDFNVAYHGPCSSNQECADRDQNRFCSGAATCTVFGTCTYAGDPCLSIPGSVCNEVTNSCDGGTGPGACCVGDICVAEVTEADCANVVGSFQGAGTICDEFTCTGPGVQEVVDVVLEDPLAETGHTVGPAPKPPVNGSCCIDTDVDGHHDTCVGPVTEEQCFQLDAFAWFTAGGTCSGIISGCCLDGDGDGHDDLCVDMDETCCLIQGGSVLANLCSGFVGACCLDWDGDGVLGDLCTVMDLDCCLSSGGDFLGDGSTCQGDTDGNGLDNACEGPSVAAPKLPGVVSGIDHDIRKNRFVSINPINSVAVSLRVQLLDNVCSTTGLKCGVDGDCKTCDSGPDVNAACAINSDCLNVSGQPPSLCVVSGETCVEQTPPVTLGWAGDPTDASIAPNGNPTSAPAGTMVSLIVASQPTPRLWTEEVVHLMGCPVAPGENYGISATTNGSLFSDSLVVGTIIKPQGKDWGDLVGNFTGVFWTPPNGLVGVDDVSAILKFITLKNAPHITVLDLAGKAPRYVNFLINATDLGQVLRSFKGEIYPSTADKIDGYPPDRDVTLCPPQ